MMYGVAWVCAVWTVYVYPGMSHLVLEERRADWLLDFSFLSLDSAPTINRQKRVRDFATDEKMRGGRAWADWFSYQITVPD